MLVKQGEEEFGGERVKGRKMVTAMKTNINPNPYAIATVVLVLNNEKWILKSEIKFRPPKPMGACFVISAIWAAVVLRNLKTDIVNCVCRDILQSF